MLLPAGSSYFFFDAAGGRAHVKVCFWPSRVLAVMWPVVSGNRNFHAEKIWHSWTHAVSSTTTISYCRKTQELWKKTEEGRVCKKSQTQLFVFDNKGTYTYMNRKKREKKHKTNNILKLDAWYSIPHTTSSLPQTRAKPHWQLRRA